MTACHNIKTGKFRSTTIKKKKEILDILGIEKMLAIVHESFSPCPLSTLP